MNFDKSKDIIPLVKGIKKKISTKNENINKMMKKYNLIIKNNNFLEKEGYIKIFGNNQENEDCKYLQEYFDIHHLRTFDVNNIFKKMKLTSDIKRISEKSTIINKASLKKKKNKKVTFSTIEVTKIESYKKYNKNKKYFLNKSIKDLDNSSCILF